MVEMKEDLTKMYHDYFRREEEYIKFEKESIDSEKRPLLETSHRLERELTEAKQVLAKSESKDSRSDEVLSALELGQAIVPALWPFEVTNVLISAERKKRIASADFGKILGQLSRLPIAIEAPPTSARCAELVQLAHAHGLSTYDAAYLEAALRLKLPLATKDAQLSKSAKRVGVALLPS